MPTLPTQRTTRKSLPVTSSSDRRGFTLIELLTVISIIAVLAAIVIPTVGMVQVSARKAKSSSNLSSIGKALELYSQKHRGLIPAPEAGSSESSSGSGPGSANPTGGSWLMELVPDMEGTLTQSPGSPIATVTGEWPAGLSCPEFVATNNGISNPDKRGYGMNIWMYRAGVGNANANKQYTSARQLKASLPNPANNVIVATSNDVIIDAAPNGKFPQSGNQYSNGDPKRFGSVGLYLMLEGSVQALSEDDAAKVLASQTENAP